MAAQDLVIEDLNKRLEMGKLEYHTLMKKHQSLPHRQNMEEECTYPEGLATVFEGLAKFQVSVEKQQAGVAEPAAQTEHRGVYVSSTV